MPTTLKKHRHHAFVTQQGLCYYCGLPMWEDDPEAYAKTHDLTPGQAADFKCTAEHLIARQDGGKDTSKNVVAACLCCNSRRHKNRVKAPSPERYRGGIQKQLRNGTWLKRSVAAKIAAWL